MQFLKNPDILHWGFETSWLGEDDWGVWIAAPAGTKRWKGETIVRPSAEHAVFCVPREGWWHLHYNGSTTQFSHFVDIVTPARWIGQDRYEMVDLDLDVVRRQDGAVEVEDEDEFEVHQKKYRYTHEMIDRAVSETRWVVDALENKREPFFEVADDWLRRVG